jgi:ABC-2 type transport system ATP-binding protein
MPSAVSITDLHKTYAAKGKSPAVDAVRGISFEVGEGEFFGLLGPNGAGKSTTIGCITSLVKPTSGRIVVDGVDVVARSAEAKRRIAMVPQTRNLDRDLTVREVLTYHGRYFGLNAAERETRADRLLQDLQIAEKAGVKPLTLSGGQQQRVMIARALMHDPKVLLLDEPTTGLDPQARRQLWTTLRALHKGGVTIILTTHYMEEADQLCDRLAVVDHGKILAIGTPTELKKGLPSGHILDLWLRGHSKVAERLASIEGVLKVETVESKPEDDASGVTERLRLFIDGRDGLLEPSLQAVREAGANLHHVSLASPSLEDVYIHLTGKDLRE